MSVRRRSVASRLARDLALEKGNHETMRGLFNARGEALLLADKQIWELRGNLSLAEEGLANYAQDHKQYVDWVSPQLERLGREMAQNERMRIALEKIAKHRLRGRKTQGALLAEAALDCSHEPQPREQT